jgi:hypothetical protein
MGIFVYSLLDAVKSYSLTLGAEIKRGVHLPTDCILKFMEYSVMALLDHTSLNALVSPHYLQQCHL